MSDEPYRPGGEHCPKCGYRHDGRCPDERERFIKRCEEFYDERGFPLSPLAGWNARQPEIDALREYACLLYGYITHGGEFEDELPDSVKRVARKLGIVQDARQAHGVEPGADSAATQALKARAERHCHEDE